MGRDPDPIGLVATPGMPYDRFCFFGVTYDKARAGCYHGSPRLADMDLDGVAQPRNGAAWRYASPRRATGT